MRVLTGVSTGDSTALALIGPVRWLTDGKLVVSDLGATRLVVFDADGQYLRALGRDGAGPGEMRHIASVSLMVGDTIATYDASLRRLSFWHVNAGFVRQVGPLDGGSLDAWPADAWPWQDSLLVVLQLATTPRPTLMTGEVVRRWQMQAQLTLRDSAGRILHASPPFNGMYTGVYASGDTRLPFSNQPFVALDSDRIYFGSGEQFVLTQLTPAFAVQGALRWPLQNEPLSAEEVSRVRDETIAQLAQRVPLERAQQAFDKSFRPEIVPVERPAIGRVLIDSEQRVWVERFEATRLSFEFQPSGAYWSILKPDGSAVAKLVLPENTRLEAVLGRRVAVVQRDAMDVQTIAIYELRQR